MLSLACAKFRTQPICLNPLKGEHTYKQALHVLLCCRAHVSPPALSTIRVQTEVHVFWPFPMSSYCCIHTPASGKCSTLNKTRLATPAHLINNVFRLIVDLLSRWFELIMRFVENASADSFRRSWTFLHASRTSDVLKLVLKQLESPQSA